MIEDSEDRVEINGNIRPESEDQHVIEPTEPRKGVMHSWLRDLVISVVVSAFIIIFLYQPVRVEGTSMLPMLEDQDRLFINKIAYKIGEIHRGDVVVFRYPHDQTKSYIKRVIALPGDDLRIDRGRVYVNGKAIEIGR